jgi:hypothetical protein
MVLTCMWTTPSGDSLFNDHPFGTFDAWSGRRPPHQSHRFRIKPVTSGLDSIPDMSPPRNDQPHVPGGDITPLSSICLLASIKSRSGHGVDDVKASRACPSPV